MKLSHSYFINGDNGIGVMFLKNPYHLEIQTKVFMATVISRLGATIMGEQDLPNVLLKLTDGFMEFIMLFYFCILLKSSLKNLFNKKFTHICSLNE